MLQQDPERRRPVQFELGRVLITPAAALILAVTNTPVDTLLARHQTGDYGTLCAEDREVNRKALRLGCSVLSVYDLPSSGEKIFIITDGPRDRTTVLLAREY
jgi:hypothetical protein